MKVSSFTIILFVFLLACSSNPRSSKVDPDKSVPVEKVEDALPTIDGRPISDLPVGPDLQDLWSEGQGLLTNKPPALAGGANAETTASWLGAFTEWSRLFFAQRQKLIKKFAELRGGPRMTLFSHLLFANIDARFIRRLEALAVPDTLSETSYAYVQNTIDLKIAVLVEATISEFKAAGHGLPMAHESLNPWMEISEKEALFFSTKRESYDKSELHNKTKYKQRIDEKWPTECQTKGVKTFQSYEGKRNNASKKQRVAILIEKELEDFFKEDLTAYAKFRKALTRSIGKLAPKAKVVPFKEIDAAKGLVAERKLSEKSKVCAAAPPLEAVLQNRYKNLVTARISKMRVRGLCYNWDPKLKKSVPKKDCKADSRSELTAYLSAYGPNKNFKANRFMGVVETKDERSPVAWVNAAKSLKNANFGGILGALGRLSKGTVTYQRFYDKGYQDSWFEKTKTLNENKNLEACNTAGTPLSYDIDWEVSPEGKSENVKMTWVRPPKTFSNNIRERELSPIKICIEEAVRATPWRCPSSGKSTKLSSRVCEKKSYQWW